MGFPTAVSCAGSAEVPCTYCLSAMVVRVSGVVCLTAGSITAASVLAGFTEKYTMPVPVCWPSETVTSMPARPEDMDPALNTSCPSARVETVSLVGVFAGGCGYEGERVAVGIGEAAQRVGGVGRSLFHVDFRWRIGLLGRVVVPAYQCEAYVGVGGLPASVGDFIAERYGSFGCRGSVELQISSVVYRGKR